MPEQIQQAPAESKYSKPNKSEQKKAKDSKQKPPNKASRQTKQGSLPPPKAKQGSNPPKATKQGAFQAPQAKQSHLAPIQTKAGKLGAPAAKQNLAKRPSAGKQVIQRKEKKPQSAEATAISPQILVLKKDIVAKVNDQQTATLVAGTHLEVIQLNWSPTANELVAIKILTDDYAGQSGIVTNEDLVEGMAKHTFSDDQINKTRTYFEANKKKPKKQRDDCITAVNQGIRLLYDKQGKKTKLGSTMTKTMDAMEKANNAVGKRKEIWFLNAQGNTTENTSQAPFKPSESTWDAVIEMADGEIGWIVITMGILDGHHSVTLTLDNRDPSKPIIYWSDQWFPWEKMNKQSLDEKITASTTRNWYNYAVILPKTEGERPVYHKARTLLMRVKPHKDM
ncbi:MAG TPA: hypothetical protein DCS93_15420 [Microscillaceae bacterium]|nr:hypothetical protein [Microscillaceae bacterium]